MASRGIPDEAWILIDPNNKELLKDIIHLARYYPEAVFWYNGIKISTLIKRKAKRESATA